ncbi:MAG: radical SAM protein [Candidatus Hadarchaeales archaeon]
MVWHGLYSVTWNITSKCNFSCKHCYVPPSERRDLSTAEARKLLSQIADLGAEELYISGGEPLARGDLFDLIRYAVDLGLRVAVITNGWYLTKEKAKLFHNSGVDHVSVSVDGIGRTHDEFRNKAGSFKRCLRAIKLLKGAGVKTYLSPTFSKHNLRELPALLSLALKLRVNFSTKVMIPMGQAKSLAEYCLTPQEQKGLYEYLLAKKAELNGRLDIVTTCNPYAGLLSGRRKRPSNKIRGGCTAGVSILCVSADGNVLPCSRLQLMLGNVRETTLREIWYSSELLAALRDRDNLKGRCGACDYKNWCGGCRAMAFARSGDFLAEDPTCWMSS